LCPSSGNFFASYAIAEKGFLEIADKFEAIVSVYARILFFAFANSCQTSPGKAVSVLGHPYDGRMRIHGERHHEGGAADRIPRTRRRPEGAAVA
jgi:hypothetical protein